MHYQKNKSGRYEFVPTTERKPGLEGVSMAGFAGPDLNMDSNNLGLDGAAELSVTGTIFAGAYAGCLEFLELQPLVSIGRMTRKEQLMRTKSAAWTYTKDRAVWILCIAALAAFLPGLGPIFGALGFLGMTTMSYRLLRQFYAAMNGEELERLRKSAEAAGIPLVIPDDIAESKESKPFGTAGGYTEVDPLPNPA